MWHHWDGHWPNRCQSCIMCMFGWLGEVRGRFDFIQIYGIAVLGLCSWTMLFVFEVSPSKDMYTYANAHAKLHNTGTLTQTYKEFCTDTDLIVYIHIHTPKHVHAYQHACHTDMFDVQTCFRLRNLRLSSTSSVYRPKSPRELIPLIGPILLVVKIHLLPSQITTCFS